MLLGHFAEYRGFRGAIHYSYELGMYYCTVPNFGTIFCFHPISVEALYEQFKKEIDCYFDGKD